MFQLYKHKLNFCKKKKSVAQSCSTLCDPWTIAHQAPLSMEFSSQEYRSGLPFSSPGDLPDPGITPKSPALQADSLLSEAPGEPKFCEHTLLVFPSYLEAICVNVVSAVLSAWNKNLSSFHNQHLSLLSDSAQVLALLWGFFTTEYSAPRHFWTFSAPVANYWSKELMSTLA